MNQNSNHKPNKHALRDAQARHQSDLFGGQAPKPSAQRAESESRQRGQALNQAASQKRQQLTPEEAQTLAELQAKSRGAGASAQAQSARPQTPVSQLHHASRRNDLAAAALNNMQRNLKSTPKPPTPQQSAPAAPPAPAQPPQPSQPRPPAGNAPAGQPPRPAGTPRPRGSRPTPNPEELDRLLREMAQRSAARRAAGGQAGQPPRPGGGLPPRPVGAPGAPGAERGESMPTAEAPPEPPPEVQAEEEKSVEKQAEILRELKAREAAAQRDIRPIPQADQERAEERPVEATVPIRTEGNAVSAAPLHAAIADLQSAMRAHDAPGQVEGVNQVQRTMPNHPLYRPGENHGA